MPQQNLHGTQIGAAFQKMRGKGMPEGMRRDLTADARRQRVFLDGFPDVLPREPVAGTVDEKQTAVGGKFGAAVGDIVLQPGLRLGMQGHQALLAALAEHPHEPALQVDVLQRQAADFRHPQARRIQHLHEAAVPPAGLVAQIRLRKQALHLLAAQHLGQVLRQPGTFQQGGGIGRQHFLLHGKGKKAAQGRQAPGQTAPRVLPRTQPGQKKHDVLLAKLEGMRGGRPPAHVPLVQIEEEELHILPVGFHRPHGKSPLGQKGIGPDRDKARQRVTQSGKGQGGGGQAFLHLLMVACLRRGSKPPAF